MSMFKKSEIATSMFGALCLMAGIVGADTAAVLSESFESAAEFPITGWSGNGTLNSVSYNYDGNVYPIADENHTKVLSVEGFVTVDSGVSAPDGATVDMMVQVVLPDDELEMPAAETEAGGIQIAVGIDKVTGEGNEGQRGELKIYTGNTESPWLSTGKMFGVGTWIRVSLVFKYADNRNRCQVLVDGEPVVASGGYATADADSVSVGSWYALASNPTESKVASVKIVGSTSIDDMVVKALTADESPVSVVKRDESGKIDKTHAANFVAAGSATDSIKVDKQWLVDNDIQWTAEALIEYVGSSGMTVAEKYAAGLSPADDSKLELKTMKMKTEDGVVKVTIGHPKTNAGIGYKNVIQVSSDNSVWDTGAEVSKNNETTVSISGESNVFYYRIVTVKE